MTTEYENGDRDDLVSKTYRELDAERTPEHLNQTILRMASKDAKRSWTNSFLSTGWMKPVAWAATIGLSLAIVLELTQVPTTEVPRSELPSATSPAAESVSEDSTSTEKQALGRAQEQGLRQTEALLQEAREDEFVQDVRKPAPENKAMRRPAAAPVQRPAQDSAVILEESIILDADRLQFEAKREIAEESNPEPVVDQAAARKRSADAAVAVEGVAALATAAETIESDIAPACDPKSRSSADDWLACIEDLRASGAIEQADLEYEAYILEYPAESDEN